MTKTITTRYDVAEHLRTPEEMAAYLGACLEEANTAGLDSACARAGAQHHPDRFARIIAPLETSPSLVETLCKCRFDGAERHLESGNPDEDGCFHLWCSLFPALQSGWGAAGERSEVILNTLAAYHLFLPLISR
jgi:hypothetical protein